MDERITLDSRKNMEHDKAKELKLKLSQLADIKKSILENNPSADNERLRFLLKRL